MDLRKKVAFCLATFGISAGAVTVGDQLAQVNQDASAVMRALDVLFAREEMKRDATFNAIQWGELTHSEISSETDRKVALLTNSAHLDKCVTKYTESADKSANPQLAHLEYSGAECPFAITADVKVKHVGQTDMDAAILFKIQILSPELRGDLDLEEMTFPVQAKIKGVMDAKGIKITTKLALNAIIKSQKLGKIVYSGIGDMLFIMGNQGIKTTNKMVETFKGTSLARVFRQEAEGDMVSMTEKYFVDNKPVTKEEFAAQHENIPIPGFETSPSPLNPTLICQVRSYDAKKVTLPNLRDAIKGGTVEQIPFMENSGPVSLAQTGKIQIPFGGAWELELQVTKDVVRAVFTEVKDHKDLGKVTGLIAEKFDLAKTVGDRQIRLNCEPQQ